MCRTVLHVVCTYNRGFESCGHGTTGPPREQYLTSLFTAVGRSGADGMLDWAYRCRDPKQAGADASSGMVLEGDGVGCVLLDAPEGFVDVVIDSPHLQSCGCMARLGCEAYIGARSRLIAEANHKCPAETHYCIQRRPSNILHIEL